MSVHTYRPLVWWTLKDHQIPSQSLLNWILLSITLRWSTFHYSEISFIFLISFCLNVLAEPRVRAIFSTGIHLRQHFKTGSRLWFRTIFVDLVSSHASEYSPRSFHFAEWKDKEKQESWRTIQWTSLQWSLYNALGNVLWLACTGPAPFLDHNDASVQPWWGRISEQEWNVNIYTYKHFKYFSFCPVPQLWGFRAPYLLITSAENRTYCDRQLISRYWGIDETNVEVETSGKKREAHSALAIYTAADGGCPVCWQILTGRNGHISVLRSWRVHVTRMNRQIYFSQILLSNQF